MRWLLSLKTIFIFCSSILKGNSESQLDIAFIVGASDPGASRLFKFELDIVKAFIDRNSPITTRYGLITYGNQAYTRMSFGDFQDKSTMKKFIDLIRWSEDGTALDDALQKARNLFQESSPLHSRKLLVVFITSQTGTSIRELENKSRKLRENGVNILVIPIGNNANNREISGITTRRQNVIRVTPKGGTRTVVIRTEEIIATDPCSAVDCDYYGICNSDEQGSTSCVCQQTYLELYQPVCGSDLKTYSNLEAMKVASCNTRRKIVQRSTGKCSKCETSPFINYACLRLSFTYLTVFSNFFRLSKAESHGLGVCFGWIPQANTARIQSVEIFRENCDSKL